MPFYSRIKNLPNRERTATRLLALRKQMKDQLPKRDLESNLLLATWNIRDFDSNKFGHGPRHEESLYYIAEVISGFDLVAIQEVNDDLEALKSVQRILGFNYDYICTDITEGTSGNGERMAFMYDKRKVTFQKIAGEVVLPDSVLISEKKQFARTPFMVSFQCGWFKFNLCTVHLYFGDDSGAGLARRIEEIDAIAKFFAKRVKESKETYFLLGDFNIVSPEHETMEALLKHKFLIPEPLRNSPPATNMFQTKHYDQIAYKSGASDDELKGKVLRAGAFNYYESVFRDTDDDFAAYNHSTSTKLWDFDDKGIPLTDAGRRTYYAREWRTWQMSDHLPLWIEVSVNRADEYLAKLEVP